METTPPQAAHKGAQYSGKQHKWAERATTRANIGLKTLTPTIGVLALTIYINKTIAAKRFYVWFNHNYTPFQINAWWSFVITREDDPAISPEGNAPGEAGME